MSCHMTDSIFFQTKCPKIINSATWLAVYDEMYYSAYDTTMYVSPLSLYDDSQDFLSDTIPMGIMNYAFYKLKNDALNTGKYFNFNVQANTLTDKIPRHSSPYLDSNLFAVAPLIESSYFSDPVFRIDPDFILYDVHNSNKYGNEFDLFIDFGDGNGFRKFDPSRITHHQVNYKSKGSKYITTQIRPAKKNIVIHSSISKISVETSQKCVKPQSTMSLPGLNVGVYSGCNSVGIKSGKVILYLPGMDILDAIPSMNRDIPRIYSEMISNNKIVQLKNQGYTFLVVDYKRSTIDMRFNALYLVNLLESLKCELDYGHQFVIMGESMGGLIARYALTYMESNYYDNQDVSPFFTDVMDENSTFYLHSHAGIFNLPDKWCLTDKKHNTRLLLTLDTPHQGANIPLSVQHAYETGMQAFSRIAKFRLRNLTKMTNLFIDAQAAQQMLIYHIDSKAGNNYDSHIDKEDFFYELNMLGDYPQNCKVTALSNGSLAGEAQTNYYTSQDRVAGDNLMDFDGEFYCYILGRRIKILGAELHCKTNKPGNTQIYKAYAYLNTPTINLYLFGIKIQLGKTVLVNDQAKSNALAYGVNSGGFTGDPLFISPNAGSSSHNVSNNYFLNIFHRNYISTGNGCIGFNTHVGWNGFLSANIDATACSDGLHFTLVPTQSALDYGTLGSYPLDHDIESENIQTKLSRVKPSVIIGYEESGSYVNRNHIGSLVNPFKNPGIYNLSRQKAPIRDFTYYSCILHNDTVERGIINLEIGDEELFLENVTLNWSSYYQAEFDINVNERNPKYYYENGSGSVNSRDGMYSKNDPFIISSAAQATFITDKFNSPTRKGLTYNAPFSGPYYRMDSVLKVCCVNFINGRSKPSEKTEIMESTDAYLKVFPNPISGDQLNIQFQLTIPGNVKLNLIDSKGRNVFIKSLGHFDSEKEVNYNLRGISDFAQGMYIVRLECGSEILSQVIIIQQP